MKKIFAAISLSVLVLSVSSCDLFRSLAGRPTSAELKSAIEKQQSSAQQMQAITEEPAETTQQAITEEPAITTEQTAPEETIAVASPQAKKEEYTMV